MTHYVILGADDEEGGWRHLGERDSYSAKGAIRAFAVAEEARARAGAIEDYIEFAKLVAIPASSWKPKRLSVEPTTRIRLS